MYTRGLWITAAVWAASCLVLAFMALLGAAPQISQVYSNIIQIAASLVAALLCFRTMRAFAPGAPMRMVWALLGSGVFAWCVGAIIYALYQWTNGGAEPPYPWYSDIGYLLMMPLVALGMSRFQYLQEFETPGWAIIAGAALFVISLVTGFSSSQEALQEAQSAAEYNVEIAYIVLDPLLLSMTVMVASVLAGGGAAVAWWYVLGGLVLHYFGNVAFNYQVANHSYATGGLTDVTWPLAFGLIAMSALMTHAMPDEEALVTAELLQSE
jgi:hypothetical protein